MSMQIVSQKHHSTAVENAFFQKKSNFRRGSKIFNMKLNANFFKATTSKIVKFSFKHKTFFFVLLLM